MLFLWLCLLLLLLYSDFLGFHLSYFIIILQMPAYFLGRDRKGMDLDERGGREELAGAGGRETINRI